MKKTAIILREDVSIPAKESKQDKYLRKVFRVGSRQRRSKVHLLQLLVVCLVLFGNVGIL